jgi:hypothetical protein
MSCDQIIFGVEPVKQLIKGQLLENDTRLCVSQYEQHFGIQSHPELVQQYQVRILSIDHISDNIGLSKKKNMVWPTSIWVFPLKSTNSLTVTLA